MALNLSVWEDSGAVIGGHGTTREEVDNIGFKDSSVPESVTFADYPIRRPTNDDHSELFRVSYKKYFYFKFAGTYTDVKNFAVFFDGDPEGIAGSSIAGNLRVIYKWTNTYEVPDNNLLSGITYDPTNAPIWVPKISSVGPEAATSYINNPTANTTYYTQYLVTQLYLDISSDDDYGNLEAAYKLKFILNEPKTGLPGFDATLINWNP